MGEGAGEEMINLVRDTEKRKDVVLRPCAPLVQQCGRLSVLFDLDNEIYCGDMKSTHCHTRHDQ